MDSFLTTDQVSTKTGQVQRDRGKEPERDRNDYPWFWNGQTFTEERRNDFHFTNADKRAARQRRGAA